MIFAQCTVQGTHTINTFSVSKSYPLLPKAHIYYRMMIIMKDVSAKNGILLVQNAGMNFLAINLQRYWAEPIEQGVTEAAIDIFDNSEISWKHKTT